VSSGAYVAASGVSNRLEQLDRLAADIANATTAGYKGQQTSTAAAERESFDDVLQSAIDVTEGRTRIDMRSGTLASTGRDLDVAIEGDGFFVIETPNGERYTRSGHFTRRSDGTLVTADDYPVMGEGGPIQIPANVAVQFTDDGTVRSGAQALGKLRVVDIGDSRSLERTGQASFKMPAGSSPAPAGNAQVRGGMLEQSNVSVVDRVAQLVGVTRSYDALNRGVSVMMNDVAGRAIQELGRR